MRMMATPARPAPVARAKIVSLSVEADGMVDLVRREDEGEGVAVDVEGRTVCRGVVVETGRTDPTLDVLKKRIDGARNGGRMHCETSTDAEASQDDLAKHRVAIEARKRKRLIEKAENDGSGRARRDHVKFRSLCSACQKQQKMEKRQNQHSSTNTSSDPTITSTSSLQLSIGCHCCFDHQHATLSASHPFPAAQCQQRNHHHHQPLALRQTPPNHPS